MDGLDDAMGSCCGQGMPCFLGFARARCPGGEYLVLLRVVHVRARFTPAGAPGAGPRTHDSAGRHRVVARAGVRRRQPLRRPAGRLVAAVGPFGAGRLRLRVRQVVDPIRSTVVQTLTLRIDGVDEVSESRNLKRFVFNVVGGVAKLESEADDVKAGQTLSATAAAGSQVVRGRGPAWGPTRYQ